VGIQPSMLQTSDPSRESAEVQAVLSSQAFSKSPNLAKLLNYLCNRYFSGNVEGLNEYCIGVEALGRPTNFDPATNSIVRVEIHRLRERLRKYYGSEGSDHSLRIVLKAGSIPLCSCGTMRCWRLFPKRYRAPVWGVKQNREGTANLPQLPGPKMTQGTGLLRRRLERLVRIVRKL
jgi:hypothetical protein